MAGNELQNPAAGRPAIDLCAAEYRGREACLQNSTPAGKRVGSQLLVMLLQFQPLFIPLACADES